jgi:hypothetical protein
MTGQTVYAIIEKSPDAFRAVAAPELAAWLDVNEARVVAVAQDARHAHNLRAVERGAQKQALVKELQTLGRLDSVKVGGFYIPRGTFGTRLAVLEKSRKKAIRTAKAARDKYRPRGVAALEELRAFVAAGEWPAAHGSLAEWERRLEWVNEPPLDPESIVERELAAFAEEELDARLRTGR